ncbi:hypothetical protein P6U16_17275 [Rhizobium sp. 32-5/1]|nr:hypothetical protein [Rhizobium sp. 32-5/1]WEZ82752.1 hypothetical protein P6U16_17275 [Rhizobium sp. 32-5/1]
MQSFRPIRNSSYVPGPEPRINWSFAAQGAAFAAAFLFVTAFVCGIL